MKSIIKKILTEENGKREIVIGHVSDMIINSYISSESEYFDFNFGEYDDPEMWGEYEATRDDIRNWLEGELSPYEDVFDLHFINSIYKILGLKYETNKKLHNDIYHAVLRKLISSEEDGIEYIDESIINEGSGGEIDPNKKEFYKNYVIKQIIGDTEWDVFSNTISFPFEYDYSLGYFLEYPESIDELPYNNFTSYVIDRYHLTEDFTLDIYLDFKTEMVDHIKDNKSIDIDNDDWGY